MEDSLSSLKVRNLMTSDLTKKIVMPPKPKQIIKLISFNIANRLS